MTTHPLPHGSSPPAGFAARRSQAEASPAFRHYQEVRDHVFAMLNAAQARDTRASDYWEEELEGFDYMFDASPLIVAKLREHCYHLTGLRSYEYRAHHERKAKPFRKKLERLRELDRSGLFIPESPELGGYGHPVADGLLNIDTLKFYESLIALDHAGLLAPLRADGASPLVMEIGAGWGGFGYQIKTVAPGTTYVIVDLPQTILFSATYLRTLFPAAKCRFWSEDGIRGDVARGDTDDGFDGADFVFIPHFAFEEVEFPKLDLAVNMVSFQEMTTEQVEGYVSRLRQLGCGTLYSHNRDRSSYNRQLSSVAAILESHYSVQEIELLEIPYTNLVFPEEHRFSLSGLRHPRQWVRNSLKATLEGTRRVAQKASKTHYRHLIGTAVGSAEPARS